MGNKTKKIIAGIGMGLMLAGGSMLATGCTDVNLTQEQTDKILQVVDNCDDFMNNTMNILEEQNNQIDAKQAYKLYQMAIAKLELNYDNVWSSLKITTDYSNRENHDSDQQIIYKFFIKTNGYGIMRIMRDSNGDGIFDDDKIADYETNTSDSSTDAGNIGDVHVGTFDYMVNHCINSILNVAPIDEENILKYEILENGDYKLFAVQEITDERVITEFVINKDGLLVSKDYYTIERWNPSETYKTTVHLTINVEYDTVTIADFA